MISPTPFARTHPERLLAGHQPVVLGLLGGQAVALAVMLHALQILLLQPLLLQLVLRRLLRLGKEMRER